MRLNPQIYPKFLAHTPKIYGMELTELIFLLLLSPVLTHLGIREEHNIFVVAICALLLIFIKNKLPRRELYFIFKNILGAFKK